ncbi:hypothetical protein V6Z11_D09G018600 [Gossypium hirsutum]
MNIDYLKAVCRNLRRASHAFKLQNVRSNRNKCAIPFCYFSHRFFGFLVLGSLILDHFYPFESFKTKNKQELAWLQLGRNTDQLNKLLGFFLECEKLGILGGKRRFS